MRMLLLLIVVMLVGAAGIARAGDACRIVGQKNPHGMAMKITRVWVLDSTNFMVTSVKALPFTMGATDTVWFDLCPLVRDGKPHQTQIRYMTDMARFHAE